MVVNERGKMRKLLKELQQSKLVKVAGSYATGLQTADSDIDFYVKPDKPDTDFDKRNILTIIEILKKYDIKWVSTDVGYITAFKSDNIHNNLTIALEFSDLFRKNKKKLSKVIIKGIEFTTY